MDKFRSCEDLAESKPYGKTNKPTISEVIINFVFFLVFIFFFRFISVQPGDDEIFIGLTQQFSLGEFLLHYYSTWSGRIFNNFLIYVFAKQPMIMWQIFMSLVLTVFGRTLYFFFTPLVDNKFWRKATLLIVCYFGVFLFSSAVMIPSVFWFTGSFNYVVPVAFALVAYLPFYELFYPNDTKVERFWSLSIVPIVCTALSSEQVSIGLILIISGTFLLAKIRKMNIPFHLILLFLLLVIVSIVSITAPGNWLRLEQETKIWFSDYSNFGLFERITLAFGFSMTAIINQWYYLMVFLWGASSVLLITHAKKWYTRLLSLLLFVYALVAGIRFITSLNIIPESSITRNLEVLFSFPFLLGPNLVDTATISVYIFWSLGLVLLPITWLLGLKQEQNGISYAYLYFVALFLIMASGFSPTLFASGGRTGFVPNVILLIILIRILLEIKPYLVLVTPTIILILFKMMTLLSRWMSNGYFVDYGLITMKNVFLK